MSKITPSQALDEILLDIAIAIEPSDRDRAITDRRYKKLNEHLTKPGGELSPYLTESGSVIFPQGSVAAGTVVVSGDNDDRFDLDAVVQFRIPNDWSDDEALDRLEKALQGFPDVKKIIRCTRCVQMVFANMHLDVTILDPEIPLNTPERGEIFHSPDNGRSYRVCAHPHGFAQWFRAEMQTNESFAKRIEERRRTGAIDRLPNGIVAKDASQEDLPKIIPPRLDTQRTVALKLLKRYVKQLFAKREEKSPPSIYKTFHTGHQTESDFGLCVQLQTLAQTIADELGEHIRNDTKPDHSNPAWPDKDKINDRWPTSSRDMRQFRLDLLNLIDALEKAKSAEFADIQEILMELFGETITQRSIKKYMERAGESSQSSTISYAKKTATIITSTAAASATNIRRAPAHNFHAGRIKKK